MASLIGRIGSGIGSGIRKIGKTGGSILSGAAGQETQSAADQAGQFARRTEDMATKQVGRGTAQQDAAAQGYQGVATQGQQFTEAARGMGADYDKRVAAALGQTPEQYMSAQSRAADAQAAQEAQAATQAATRNAVKAGRTAGMLPGQAGLAAAQQAGGVYAQARTGAREQAKADYATKAAQNLQGIQTQAGEMAGRQTAGMGVQQGAAGGQAGLAGQSLGAGTSFQGTAGGGYGTKTSGSAAAGSQAGGLLDKGVSAIGGIAGIFSDERLKDDIAPVSLSDTLARIKGYGFRYRGQTRPEVGVMAQDLEGTELDPAVVETPAGKMIDTRRLSTANTAALSEHEKRLREIENLVSALSEVR